MDERQRILTVLNGGKPDTIPWYADLSWWYDAEKTKGNLAEKYKGETGYLRLHQDAGAGIYLYPPRVWREEYPGEIVFSEKLEGNIKISHVTTPTGQLESISKYLPESYTFAYHSHYIKKPEDLAVLKYIFEKRKVFPDYSDFERIDTLWDGSGIPVCLAPICTSPLQTLITRWAGVQTTIDLIMEYPKEMEETMTFLQDCDEKIFEIIGESPCKIVEFPENLSGEITGKSLVEKYELPYWTKRIAQLKKKEKFVGVHNDGAVKPTVSLLIKAGYSFIEAVTPFPVGDITFEEIEEIIGDNVIVFGGIPGALFSPLYSDEYFENFLRKTIAFFCKKNYILGVADQVPPDATLKRISFVREAIENF